MLDGHSQQDTNEFDELDGLLSMNELTDFDMGKYTMKLLAGTDRLYKLKNDRSSKLMETMSTFRQEQRFCDVVLSVKGERHLAHKVVLASASSYFASMFGQPRHIEAHTTDDIDLSKLIHCPIAMSLILDFIYTSQIQLSEKVVCYSNLNPLRTDVVYILRPSPSSSKKQKNIFLFF